jgi:arsenate reductase
MSKKEKIIFICTGNACRSQIAEGIMRKLAGDNFDVFSAGSHPSLVHPMSIKVMKEIGIDITSHTSDPISNFLSKNMDIVVTVCDNADKICPVFPGEVERIHWSIKDPFKGWELNPDDLVNFTRTRDDLIERIKNFVKDRLV